MKRIVLLIGLCCVGSVLIAWSQVQDRAARLQEEQRQGVAEPYRGIALGGQITSGLFKIRSTGVSTRPIRVAAEAFLNGLGEEQRKKTMFPLDDAEWRMWDNRPRVPRQGVGFNEMSERQRDLAFELLRAGLSAKGLQKTSDIMKLNETLAEMRNDFDTFGHWLYWMTVMGKPSDTEPWGWQLDGHHAIINYFIMGDQVVMTPTFLGSEPVRADSGKFKGTIVLQEEQNKGLNLFNALSQSQQVRAVVPGSKTSSNTLAGAYRDNLVLENAGIPVSELNDSQRKLLLDLIEEYVGNMKEGAARLRMEEVRNHLNQTYFSWIGSAAPNGVFYYRIQSPVILIEFDHQSAAGNPSRDHIHTIVRTPNGNDYGKDLLRQHYLQHPHGG
jgi:hypothetical protein